jgi:hypothetical protein
VQYVLHSLQHCLNSLPLAAVTVHVAAVPVDPFAVCRELWQYCGAVFDGGRVPVTGNQGSTVLDLTAVGDQQQQQQQQDQQQQQSPEGCVGFRVVRAGVAVDSVVELLTQSFGLQQLQ